MVRLFWGKANLSTLTLIQPSLKFLKGNLPFFAQLALFTGSFTPFGKFLFENIHSTFSWVHPAVCFRVRLMDFVIFVFFGKGVDGTDFLAGFAVGGINTLSAFTVGPAGRNEEPATVFALLVQYISLGKVHKFIEHFYLTEQENSSILLILSSWGKEESKVLHEMLLLNLLIRFVYMKIRGLR